MMSGPEMAAILVLSQGTEEQRRSQEEQLEGGLKALTDEGGGGNA